ncbi:hypothetical protein [Streptomyces sp. NPDC000229]|uniref:hypothetical protein n=1 Tax=Streptomyces sp. NPDC000229 TaxID=3154247 RepID=UPI00332D5109
MADERDEWLDQDAAENLLRGEPVGPVDDHARERARQVARALDALRAAADPAAGELPGEEAALAAFREARAERAAGARAAVTPLSGSPGVADVPDLGAVRDSAGPRRRMRWARPVRWGLAASVAGLAVGGVAVGAGTGMLPVLGGESEPLPAASVSGVATPGTSASGGVTAGSGSATPGTGGEPGGVPPSASATPGAGEERVPGRPDPESNGGVGDDDGSGGPGDGTGDVPGAGPDSGSSGISGSGSEHGWPARTVEDCRDYRDGRLDRDRRERLADEAEGEANIKILCDKALSGDAQHQNGSTGAGGSTGSGSGSGSGGHGGDGSGGGSGSGTGGGSGGGEDEGRDDDDSDAARPSVSWTPLAPALSVRRTGWVF